MTACGVEPVVAFRMLLARSLHAGTALLDDEPVAMWGASAASFIGAERAHLWLVISGRVDRPPLATARAALAFVRTLDGQYDRLTTGVAEDFLVDRRFVEWLGLKRSPPDDMRLGGISFLGYERSGAYGA